MTIEGRQRNAVNRKEDEINRNALEAVEIRKGGRLSGGLDGLRLEFAQVIDGALRVSRGGEDRAVVVLQDRYPVGDV